MLKWHDNTLMFIPTLTTMSNYGYLVKSIQNSNRNYSSFMIRKHSAVFDRTANNTQDSNSYNASPKTDFTNIDSRQLVVISLSL